MPIFEYTIVDWNGQRSTGTLRAPDPESATRVLTRNGAVTHLTQWMSWHARLMRHLGLGTPRVKAEDIVILTQQLAAMLHAGMTTKAGIDVVLEGTKDPAMSQLLSDISNEMAEGQSFSEVLQKRPQVFSEQYIAMVTAGETAGKVPMILQKLATMMRESLAMQKRVRGAMYYPAFVLGFAFLVVCGLLTFCVPKFEEVYMGFGAELPLPTRFFIGVGKLLETWWAVLVLGGVAGGIALQRYAKLPAGRRALDLLKLRLPIIGPLCQHLAIAQFARSLGLLHSSGVAISISLDLVARGVNNVIIEQVVRESLTDVCQGESITTRLRRSPWFTPLSVSLMSAGEQSGSLDTMLDHLADYYEEQVDITIKSLSTLLEPVIIIGVGLVVGTIVIAMVLPIFKLTELIM